VFDHPFAFLPPLRTCEGEETTIVGHRLCDLSLTFEGDSEIQNGLRVIGREA